MGNVLARRHGLQFSRSVLPACLAERLTALSFADRALFCNSGLEAAEGAIKLARKAQHTEGKPNRTRIVTIEGAFHGRSVGERFVFRSITAMWPHVYRVHMQSPNHNTTPRRNHILKRSLRPNTRPR